ncbi:MAG: hypothetical protein IJ857_01345 [Lachnospiraceae bacterium]|nr:hypothetical protein [Lachnospiraceae bacterium]
MEKDKNPVFSVLEIVFLVVLVGAGIFFRYKFYYKTAEVNELLKEAGLFLDGMSESSFFTVPSPAGTVEAYSALFNVTGVNENLAMLLIIGLEAVSNVLFFILAKKMLGSFYAFISLPVFIILDFLGIPIGVYEELPVLCLLLFLVMLSLTRKFEEFSDEGPLYFRYVFIGVAAGLAIFMMPGNVIMIGLSLLLSLYFLLSKRKIKLLPEYLIALMASAVIFLLLITMRVMNTALLLSDLMKGYIEHLFDPWGTEYLVTAILLMILFIIEIIVSVMPGKKMEKEMKKRPVSTGGLPGDFVLHRAGDKDKTIVASAGNEDKKEEKKEARKPEKVRKSFFGSKDKTKDKAEIKAEVKTGEKTEVRSEAKPDIKADVMVNATVGKADSSVEVANANAAAALYSASKAADLEKSMKDALANKVPPVSRFATPENETEEEKQKRIAEYREYAENINPNELEFDFDIPYDDDFDVEVTF